MDYLRPDPKIYRNYESRTDIMFHEPEPTNGVLAINYDNGINVFYENQIYPKKSFPTPEQVFAANLAKRALTFAMNPFMIFGWRKNKARFERMAGYDMERLYYKKKYMTPVCREICNLRDKIGDSADIIGHIFEFDSAYRYRLQDIMSECDANNLFNNPSGEIIKLLDIATSRETTSEMKAKYKYLYWFAWLLILPPVKQKFLEIIKDINFEKLKLDESDKYWVTGGGGYRFMGRDWDSEPCDIFQTMK